MRIVYKADLIRLSSPSSLFSVPSQLPVPPLITTSPVPLAPLVNKVSKLYSPDHITGINMTLAVSVIPSEFAQCPFPSSSPNLIYALATQQDWWSYRQLRALHPNLSHGQLHHCPFYRPATHLSFTEPTPIQVGTEHYFEWLHKESRIPLVAFHLIIHPTFAFGEPLFTFSSIHLKPFPIIHCLWSDCPRHIN